MGGLEQRKEEMRDTRHIHWLTDFRRRRALRHPEPAPHARADRVRGDHDRAGNRDDHDAVQHARCADLPAVPRAASARRGHAGEHVTRQQLRLFLLSRVPGHPRPHEELRRRDRQRTAQRRRLQRRSPEPRRWSGPDCWFPATTSVCSAWSRSWGAVFGRTKTRCPAAMP